MSVASPTAAAAPTRVCLAVQHPVAWVAAWVLTRLQTAGVTVDDAPAGSDDATAGEDGNLAAVLASFEAADDDTGVATTATQGTGAGVDERQLVPVARSRAVGVLTHTLHTLVQRLTNLARDATTTHSTLDELIALGGECGCAVLCRGTRLLVTTCAVITSCGYHHQAPPMRWTWRADAPSMCAASVSTLPPCCPRRSVCLWGGSCQRHSVDPNA